MVKRKYHQEYDIAPPITFGGDHVALEIPDDGIHTDNGWDIVPLQKARVSYRILEDLHPKPSCLLVYVKAVKQLNRSWTTRVSFT